MTTITAYATRYRPGRRRVERPLVYRGRRRAPGRLAYLISANPGYGLGILAAVTWTVAALFAQSMGLLDVLFSWL